MPVVRMEVHPGILLAEPPRGQWQPQQATTMKKHAAETQLTSFATPDYHKSASIFFRDNPRGHQTFASRHTQR